MKIFKFIIPGVLSVALIACTAEAEITGDEADTEQTDETTAEKKCEKECEKECCAKDKHEFTEACGDECKAHKDGAHVCTDACGEECKAHKDQAHVCTDKCGDGCKAPKKGTV
jgi:hypothetical protein